MANGTLTWTPVPSNGPTRRPYQLVSGPWTIAKWYVGDVPWYTLFRHKGERWPPTGGFKTKEEAMEIAEAEEVRA